MLHLFFFNKKLRLSSSFFQFPCRNGKPADPPVRHIRIHCQLLTAFQRLRKLHRRSDPLASHQIRIFKSFQGADYLQALNFRLYLRAVQTGAHFCFLWPGSLQNILTGILQVKPVLCYLKNLS